MAYRLQFFVGHFIHDGRFAIVQIDETSNLASLRVRQPLDECEMRTSAIGFCGGDARRVMDWDIYFKNDQMVFCEFSDPTALAWIRELMRTRHLDVIDGSTFRLVPLSDL
jgi:hypothetical protein